MHTQATICCPGMVSINTIQKWILKVVSGRSKAPGMLRFNEYDPEVDTERHEAACRHDRKRGFNEYDPEVDTESPEARPPAAFLRRVSMNTIQKWILKEGIGYSIICLLNVSMNTIQKWILKAQGEYISLRSVGRFNKYDPEVDTERGSAGNPSRSRRTVSMNTIQKWILKARDTCVQLLPYRTVSMNTIQKWILKVRLECAVGRLKHRFNNVDPEVDTESCQKCATVAGPRSRFKNIDPAVDTESRSTKRYDGESFRFKNIDPAVDTERDRRAACAV